MTKYLTFYSSWHWIAGCTVYPRKKSFHLKIRANYEHSNWNFFLKIIKNIMQKPLLPEINIYLNTTVQQKTVHFNMESPKSNFHSKIKRTKPTSKQNKSTIDFGFSRKLVRTSIELVGQTSLNAPPEISNNNNSACSVGHLIPVRPTLSRRRASSSKARILRVKHNISTLTSRSAATRTSVALYGFGWPWISMGFVCMAMVFVRVLSLPDRRTNPSSAVV